MLALSLARYAHTLMGKIPVRFLDPAIGTGSFFSAASQAFGQKHIAAATGIELDPLFSNTAATLWEAQGLKVINGDFTKQRFPEQGFNLVLTNPPYVRHHHLPAADKDRLKAQLAQFAASGYQRPCRAVLLLLAAVPRLDGRGGARGLADPLRIHGRELRRYLAPLSHRARDAAAHSPFLPHRRAVHRRAGILRRRGFSQVAAPGSHAARFSFGGPIEHPQSEALVPLETLRRSRKWTQFPATTTVRHRELNLGDLFAIKRGLATGANSFFILTEKDIEHWQIPRQFMKPIPPGPRHLTGDIIDALPDGAPDVSAAPLPARLQRARKNASGRLAALLRIPPNRQGSRRFTSVPHQPPRAVVLTGAAPPAPFLCTYMGRRRNGKHPFRFIWNRSQATAHNVYLMLYPTGPLRAALKAHPELHAHVFEALQRITPAQLLSEGRVYGGGLHKVEPNELAQIPAHSVLESIEAHVRIEEQMPILFT